MQVFTTYNQYIWSGTSVNHTIWHHQYQKPTNWVLVKKRPKLQQFSCFSHKEASRIGPELCDLVCLAIKLSVALTVPTTTNRKQYTYFQRGVYSVAMGLCCVDPCFIFYYIFEYTLNMVSDLTKCSQENVMYCCNFLLNLLIYDVIYFKIS